MPILGPQDQTPSLEINTRNESPKPIVVTYPEPTTAPQRSERLPDPLIFTSKQRELQLFLSRLKNKLTSNADCYLTKAN